MYDDAEKSFSEYTLDFFLNWKKSWNTAIGITLAEPIC